MDPAGCEEIGRALIPLGWHYDNFSLAIERSKLPNMWRSEKKGTQVTTTSGQKQNPYMKKENLGMKSLMLNSCVSNSKPNINILLH